MSIFTGNTINNVPTPLIPNQQVVIPQITIPQGFQAAQAQAPITQFTADGPEEAKQIKLPPNSVCAIFDKKEDTQIFYYRETDANGNDKEFKMYSYSEIEPPKPPQYLTVDQFREELREFGKSLKEELSDGQSVRFQGNNKPYNNANKQSSANSSPAK